MLLLIFQIKYFLLQNNTLTQNNLPPPGSNLRNTFNSPNTTNTHTHGLHVSSMVSGDDFILNLQT